MIYLDNSATTPPYPEVVDVVQKAMLSFFGNPSSLHQKGVEAENLLKQARMVSAQALQCKPSEIIFTSGGTEGNNAAIKGVAFQYQSRGKHIITTAVEHPSVYDAAGQLETFGFDVTYLPVDHDGRVSLESLQQAIRPDTILVSIMHVNNELGTIQPIKEIGTFLKLHPRILFHVDAVQSFGKVPFKMKEWGIDLLTLSAHKFHGPRGVGILAKREGVTLHPLLAGGGQESGNRSGTENIPGIAGLAKALRMTGETQAKSIAHMQKLAEVLRAGLMEIPECVINTPQTGSAPHIMNISFPGMKAEVLVHALEEHGIMVSTKSACSSKAQEPSRVLLAAGIKREQAIASIRISLSGQTSLEEINLFVSGLRESLARISPYMKA
ncbi:cysteine desulfurase family protein [Brevibacillus fluminis]|uniref:cysteine desulfurase family protein n=1 Tax=Brevibacillus fluminis TaxID=511487 RepID=UPI003F89BD3F